MIRLAAIAVLLCCASGALSAETPVESAATKDVSSRPLLLDSKPMPLGGVLKRAAPLWAAYKAKFITDSGRLLDTGNHMISHSEGQAMFVFGLHRP